MCQQLELPFMDQTPYTPHYAMWHELFKHDNRMKYTTPRMATKFLIAADFHEDDIAMFLKENTARCENCRGVGWYDMNMCHGMGARVRRETPCLTCHQTGTVFVNVPKHV